MLCFFHLIITIDKIFCLYIYIYFFFKYRILKETCFRLKEILRYRLYSVWNESWFDKIIFNFTTLGREQQKTSKLMHSLINEVYIE